MIEKTKIAVLVSGGGTNLQALINARKNGIINSGELSLVISSKPDVFALERAKTAGIPSLVVSRKDEGESFEPKILAALEEYKIELIVHAGFLSILSPNFCQKWENRMINIHPSLIPAFCGKGYYGIKVHEQVLASGVKITGATAHMVNEIPDGGKIIDQKAIRVLTTDTPQSLQKRVMESCEHILLPRATEKIARELQKKKTVKK